MENFNAVQLKELNEELSRKNICLQNEIQSLKVEKGNFQFNIQYLQEKCLSLQQQLKNLSNADQFKSEFNEVVPVVKNSPCSSHAFSEVRDTDSSINLGAETATNVLWDNDKNYPFSVSLNTSAKSKIKNDFSENCPGALQCNNYLNFTNLVENFITFLNDYNIKQDNVINSLQERVDISINENKNLYSNIRTLKDLLCTYGFLKLNNEKEKEPENITSFNSSLPSKLFEDFSSDIIHDPYLKSVVIPLLPLLNSSFSKLKILTEKITKLQFDLDATQKLNNNLIVRVKNQEMHFKGVRKEIEETHYLVSVLKNQHKKLQSAEGILKYDLQEKRKLLTRLRQQLESTRENFNLVRIKNSKSEAEWQDLHNEFAQRRKQTSEESGMSKDIDLHEENSLSNSVCDCSFFEGNASENDILMKDLIETSHDVPAKRKRLELLEEQCQNLYSNLLQSSKRRQDIDKRLEIICKKIQKNNNQSKTCPDNCSDNNFVDVTEAVMQISTEVASQNLEFTHEALTNTLHNSSDGNFNLECNSCEPNLYNDNSSDIHSDSTEPLSSVSFSSKLETDAFQPNKEINKANCLQDLDLNSGCNLESESMGIIANDIETSQLESMSHVDSILKKRKNLEESLKNFKTSNEVAFSDKIKFSQSEELNEMSVMDKIEELERKNIMLSSELSRTTQQLMLSNASKKHEVAALQYQLNSQALKYETSLKEFSEQSKCLESMKQRVTEQEQLILSLEEALSDICTDRENEKHHQWQELEDIHSALEVREQECVTLCQELQKSMSEVTEEHNRNELLLSQLKELKIYNQKDRESMETEILHFKQYSKELQRKLVRLLKEKDILWKRNNHLHHIQKIRISDQWMNDSEVSNCLGCKNSFSFMLRKHHCRFCGRIFCYSCSNNWLLTASSSKKLRVCNECFVQHMEIMKTVRRGSDVPCIDNDSEDEADSDYLPLISANSSSFVSEVPSSITTSVISLPITHKQSTPHFASVPDLRYLFKPEEDINSLSFTEENSKIKKKKDNINIDHKNSEVIFDDSTSVALPEIITKLNKISVDEIESHQCGLKGIFTLSPQERVDLPIFCQNCPVVLQWHFNSNSGNISLTITHEDKECSSTVFYQDSNMQGEMELYLPGYYVLHFGDDNDRNTEMEVEYIFHVKR